MSAEWQQSSLEPFLSKSNKEDYVPLRTSDDYSPEPRGDQKPNKKSRWDAIWILLLILTLMDGCGIVGFALGNRSWASSKANRDASMAHHCNDYVNGAKMWQHP